MNAALWLVDHLSVEDHEKGTVACTEPPLLQPTSSFRNRKHTCRASGSHLLQDVSTQHRCIFFSGISWKIARRCVTWPCSCAQVKTWKLISCSSIPASSSKTLLLCLLPQGPINRASETFIKAFACYSIDVDAGTTLQSGAERHRRLKAAAIHRIASYSAVTSSVSACAHKNTSCLFAKLPAACKADFFLQPNLSISPIDFKYMLDDPIKNKTPV